ncbi:MAG: carbonate dehydratase [Deltaproteobacteria bacterium]|nr:carbonate dehydratase [Deltaproteobacteria bacterium]
MSDNDDTTDPKSKFDPVTGRRSERHVGYDELLEGNRRWVERTLAEDPSYFDRLADGQAPTFLWIGCADSRVPANVITGTNPGEVFVHRNIANVVVHSDMNVMAVLQYAVEYLKVQHVIVCGHYGCGGVAAALSNRDFGLLNKWLRHIKDVAQRHHSELRAYSRNADAEHRLVELNVIEQVYNVAQTSIVQRAWHRGQHLELHGWVYDLHDGKIRDLGVNFTSPEVLERYHRFVFDE